MSTVVSFRRYIATTIANMAGAAGEILIDFTNQRAVVSDGVTLGGFPQASVRDLTSRNLLLNGNFAINQRGYASGTSLAVNAYAHDRWSSNAPGVSYTFSQTVPDTTITISGGNYLRQAIDPALIAGGSYILSYIGTAIGLVGITPPGGSPSYTNAVSGTVITGVVAGSACIVYLQAGTAGLVQFEAGNVATRFERRHNELALCQRYFVTFGGQGVYEVFGPLAMITATQAVANFRLPVTMRAVPTITVPSPSSLAAKTASGFTTFNSFTVDQVTNATLSIFGQLSASSTAGFAGQVQANATLGAVIFCSAEI